MNDQQKALLHRVIKQLELLKCEYAIVTPDGGKYGALPVAQSQPSTRRDYKQYGYTDVVAAMQVGDEYTFDECVGCDKATINNYQASIGSALHKLYGEGSYRTTRVGPGKDAIHVRRIK